VIARLQTDRTSLLIQMVVAFLAISAMAGTRPTATYRALNLGGSAFDVGLVQSAYSVLPAITAVAIGRWVDRLGEVRIYAGSLAVMALGCVASALADSMLVLAAGQAVIGFGTVAMLITGQALIANRSRPEAVNRNYGTYSAFLSLGQLVGPSAAAVLQGMPEMGPEPERAAFLASAAAVLLGAVLVLLVPARGSAKSAAETAAEGDLRAVLWQILRRPGMLAAMFIGIVVLGSIDIMLAYMPVLGETKGLSVQLVGLLLSIRAGTTLLSRLWMDRLLGRFGWVAVLAGSLGIAAGALSLVPLTVSPALLVGLIAVVGFGIGFGQPMSVTYVANRATKADRATALAVRLTANRVSLLFVPAVMGAVAGTAGVDAVFWILAATLAVGSVVAVAAKLDASKG
jgi:MFS family permease